jgi:hypothetical protein
MVEMVMSMVLLAKIVTASTKQQEGEAQAQPQVQEDGQEEVVVQAR